MANTDLTTSLTDIYKRLEEINNKIPSTTHEDGMAIAEKIAKGISWIKSGVVLLVACTLFVGKMQWDITQHGDEIKQLKLDARSDNDKLAIWKSLKDSKDGSQDSKIVAIETSIGMRGNYEK